MANLTPQQAFNGNALLLNRPMSSTGLPGVAATNINGDGSTTPIQYYIEALEGEKLMVARVIVHIYAAGNIASGEYGDLSALANGIRVFYRREIDGSFVDLDITDGLPIQKNEDWGRWCYDAKVNAIGVNTPYFQARWTLTRFGTPYGIVLNEGERLGVQINDDLTGLNEQTIICQGIHLGIPNPAWTEILT